MANVTPKHTTTPNMQHIHTASPNISAKVKPYHIEKHDVLKSKLTRLEKIFNFFSRIARSIFSRKITVFTQNVERMDDKTYLRLNCNKHIQVFRDIKNTDDNYNIKIGAEDGLSQEFVEDLARNTFYEELKNTAASDNKPITIKIPSYSTNPSEDKLSYEQYIDTYVKTIDICLRIAEKDLQIKSNRKLKLVFNSEEADIIQAENLALKKLNSNVFSYLDQHVENNNNRIRHFIEKRAQGVYRGQYNADTEYETDKKIASITTNLDNCEDIETQRQDIANKLNTITAKDIAEETEEIISELQQNNSIDFGVIKICTGKIEDTNSLGMKNAYIMNAANSHGMDGGGVTGAIYKASGHSKDITTQFQQELKNNEELTRKTDDNQPLTSHGKLALAMGKVLVTDAFDIPNVSGIVHAVAPNIRNEDNALQGKNDTEVAIAANSFEKAILLAASKKNDSTKPCDSIALVLLGGKIFGGSQLNILTALKIVSDRLKDNPAIQDLDIRLVMYQQISPEQQEIIARLRAADTIES
jgi:O-acetyl-ADP-ribose deacetylase (regulator of RNase III)